MARIPLVVGNWKMHKTIQETVDFCSLLQKEFPSGKKIGVEVAVAPPFTALAAAAQALRESRVSLCAQNVFWEKKGAYTGEVSPGMLADAGCRFVIVGHSERRQYFGETDEGVTKKAAALLEEKLTPIVCVGERLSERQEGSTFTVIERQTRGGLKGLPIQDAAELVLAYEPVWAIGTGHTATPSQAQEVQAFIRRLLGEILSPRLAKEVRILYGGSVKPDNIRELSAMEDVDGALVGGASLEVRSFCDIVRGCQENRGIIPP